jgi:hypothetical protein
MLNSRILKQLYYHQPMGRRGRSNCKVDWLINFGTGISSGLILEVVVIVSDDADGDHS